jgi:uracil-DNA glycosylase
MEHPTLTAARHCRICAAELPLGARPIFRVHPAARVALISQAPGRLAHRSGVAWDDPGGRRLREWLDVPDDLFFDTPLFAVLPIGLCYPGKGRGGDLPPRPECAPNWQAPLLALMPALRLRLLIGAYAQRYYLGGAAHTTLSDTVRHYADYLPEYFPLPHPSPRNRTWLRDRPWFATDVLPALRRHLAAALQE